MIINSEAVEGSPAHKIEILCSSCGHDVSNDEINEAKCGACNSELKVQQNVAITIPHLKMFAISL
jgi:Zn finger protein HypA/HybF involved in hydrogenase expression